MEGVLEGFSEKGSFGKDLQKGENTYLGRAIIRGSLCLLLDWTPPPIKGLLEFFSISFVIDVDQFRVPNRELTFVALRTTRRTIP
jgi:hypothetical protein